MAWNVLKFIGGFIAGLILGSAVPLGMLAIWIIAQEILFRI